MNKAPAFQFYPKDWLDFRVQRMSLGAQGAYMKILCFMWADSKDQCSILDDNTLLARALGTTVEQWLEFRGEILREGDPIFDAKDGKLYSARLAHEASGQRKYRKLQSEKGKKSAEQRFNRGSAVVQPEYQPEGNSSSSSSSSSSLSLHPKKDSEKEEKSKKKKELNTSSTAEPRGVSKSGVAWEAYRVAYRTRYGVDPVRDKQANIALCQVVDKLGIEEAPFVASFYLSHNDPFYVKKRHYQ